MIRPRVIAMAPALAGGVAALGLAPWGLWPLALLGLAFVFHLFGRTPGPRAAARIGWLFGVGYFAFGLFWIVEPFFVDPLRHGWMAPFALACMAAGLALFWGAAFWLAARGGGGLGLVAIWTLSEALRGLIFTGFPWAGFGQIWVGQGADQLLAFIGPHGLALLTLASAWALARALTAYGFVLIGLVLPAAGMGFAANLPDPEHGGQVVRIVQPNAPQHQKWDPEMIPVFWDRSLSLTATAPTPDLVVWPETSVPQLLNDADRAIGRIANAAQGAPVVVGGLRFEERRLLNSLAVVDPEGEVTAIYDKHHLVPFGEYVPFGDVLDRFGIHGFAANQGQGFSAGPGPRIVDFGMLGRGLALICYEAVFPRHARIQGDRPDFLIQITNDAWFGQISGPYQHLAQSRMRAIEQGLPMIRAANTGVSAMIDARGRIRDSLPLGQAGYLDAALPPARTPTIYARTGDWPALLAALFVLFVAFGTQRHAFRRKTN